jgi:hypothetical protein
MYARNSYFTPNSGKYPTFFDQYINSVYQLPFTVNNAPEIIYIELLKRSHFPTDWLQGA